jgi:hypothetical protein
MLGAQHPRFWILLLVVWLAAFGVAGAVPTPIGFEQDDGSELFLPLQSVLTTETFDFFASEFGFFYLSSPGNLIPIFNTDDQSGLLQPPQRARIDFALGQVFDVDQGELLQNSFVPQSSSIGFYAVSQLAIFFSVAAMNPQGDLFSSFPQIGNPTGYLLQFESPNLAIPVTTHFADGISAVPIVGTPALMLVALVAAAGFHRRSGKRG